MSRKLTFEQWVEKARSIWGNEFTYDKSTYIDTQHDVRVTCSKGHTNDVRANKHTLGSSGKRMADDHSPQGCKDCNNKLVTYDQFVVRATAIHGNHFLYDKETYIKSEARVKITCTRCQHTWSPYGYCLLNKTNPQGCPKCNKRLPQTPDEIIKRSQEKHNNFYEYVRESIGASHDYMTIICPTHGDFQTQAVQHYNHGVGCPECKNKTETKIRKMMEVLFPGHKFRLRRPDFLLGTKGKNLELDMYNDKLGIAVEYNGKQHYETVKVWDPKGNKLEEQIARDEFKEKRCMEMGIGLIIIKYTVSTAEGILDVIYKNLDPEHMDIMDEDREEKRKQCIKIWGK
nr:hypothetical protein K-LCC10_0236 [Kaumoebavirus]